MRQFAGKNVNRLPIDHHELAALIAPRALLVLGNTDYEWLAEESNYVSCQAARMVWEGFWHRRSYGLFYSGRSYALYVAGESVSGSGSFY